MRCPSTGPSGLLARLVAAASAARGSVPRGRSGYVSEKCACCAIVLLSLARVGQRQPWVAVELLAALDGDERAPVDTLAQCRLGDALSCRHHAQLDKWL